MAMWVCGVRGLFLASYPPALNSDVEPKGNLFPLVKSSGLNMVFKAIVAPIRGVLGDNAKVYLKMFYSTSSSGIASL